MADGLGTAIPDAMSNWTLDLCRDWVKIGEASSYTFNARDPADIKDVGAWQASYSPAGSSWGTYVVDDGDTVTYRSEDVDTIRLIEDGVLRYSGLVGASGSGTGGIERTVDANGERVTLSGVGLAQLFAERLAFPDPTVLGGWSVAYDLRSGVASSVLAGYLNANAAIGAHPDRVVFGLSIVDTVAGPTGDWSARFQPLNDLAARICADGGLICPLVADYDGAVVATIRLPVDYSSQYILSDQGDLRSLVMRTVPPSATWALAGGQGTGSARVFQLASDDTRGRRREAFTDQSSLATTGEVAAAAKVALALGSQSWSITADMAEGASGAIPFGTVVQPGDSIGIAVKGDRYTVPVTEINYAVSAERAEVRPVLGAAASDALRGLLRDVGGLQSRFDTTVA